MFNLAPLLRSVKALGIVAVLLTTMLTAPMPVAQAEDVKAVRLYNQGIDAYNSGNHMAALDLFRQATVMDNRYSDAWYNMGSIHYQMKKYTDAEVAFRNAYNFNPNDYQAVYNLGLTLEKLSRFDEATQFYALVPPSDRKYPKAQAKLQELAGRAPANNVATTNPATINPATTAPNTTQAPTSNTGGYAPDMIGDRQLPTHTFSTGYSGPTGLTIGPGGYLYVSNYSQNSISKVGANGDKAVFVSGGELSGPMGLAFNPKTGELYVANYLKNNIARVRHTGEIDVIATGLKKPYSLFLDLTNGALYVSEQETNSISKIDLPR